MTQVTINTDAATIPLLVVDVTPSSSVVIKITTQVVGLETESPATTTTFVDNSIYAFDVDSDGVAVASGDTVDHVVVSTQASVDVSVNGDGQIVVTGTNDTSPNVAVRWQANYEVYTAVL